MCHQTGENKFLGKEAHKRYSAVLAIREMQSETMMRHHYIPNRTTEIKNNHNTKCWQGRALLVEM